MNECYLNHFQADAEWEWEGDDQEKEWYDEDEGWATGLGRVHLLTLLVAVLKNRAGRLVLHFTPLNVRHPECLCHRTRKKCHFKYAFLYLSVTTIDTSSKTGKPILFLWRLLLFLYALSTHFTQADAFSKTTHCFRNWSQVEKCFFHTYNMGENDAMG